MFILFLYENCALCYDLEMFFNIKSSIFLATIFILSICTSNLFAQQEQVPLSIKDRIAEKLDLAKKKILPNKDKNLEKRAIRLGEIINNDEIDEKELGKFLQDFEIGEILTFLKPEQVKALNNVIIKAGTKYLGPTAVDLGIGLNIVNGENNRIEQIQINNSKGKFSVFFNYKKDKLISMQGKVLDPKGHIVLYQSKNINITYLKIKIVKIVKPAWKDIALFYLKYKLGKYDGIKGKASAALAATKIVERIFGNKKSRNQINDLFTKLKDDVGSLLPEVSDEIRAESGLIMDDQKLNFNEKFDRILKLASSSSPFLDDMANINIEEEEILKKSLTSEGLIAFANGEYNDFDSEALSSLQEVAQAFLLIVSHIIRLINILITIVIITLIFCLLILIALIIFCPPAAAFILMELGMVAMVFGELIISFG